VTNSVVEGLEKTHRKYSDFDNLKPIYVDAKCRAQKKAFHERDDLEPFLLRLYPRELARNPLHPHIADGRSMNTVRSDRQTPPPTCDKSLR